MKRKVTIYPVEHFTDTKIKILNWAGGFNIFCFLDNQQYNFSPSFECLLAAGTVKTLTAPAENAFDALHKFKQENVDWIFGHLSYDLKNEVEDLASANIDNIKFPDIFFFVPEVVLTLTKTDLSIGVINYRVEDIYQAIVSSPKNIDKPAVFPLHLKNRYQKDEYLASVKKLQQHILRGDCYEINFCQEFFAENATIYPLETYTKLSQLSPNPFSALYKIKEKWVLCASPERYLKKEGDKIYSQPIKGTSKRELNNLAADESSKVTLLNDAKERAENVMIVDLVRNDLSKICVEGSVRVEELFGIYSFPQVHQMISTISGRLDAGKSLAEIFKATFPMASMTGAPKKRVMELIELYEKTKRGIFSGALGYINPDNDFDFNVIIRSILYNAEDNYLSIQAGSAITFSSKPEEEYEECLLKIEAMKKALL